MSLMTVLKIFTKLDWLTSGPESSLFRLAQRLYYLTVLYFQEGWSWAILKIKVTQLEIVVSLPF